LEPRLAGRLERAGKKGGPKTGPNPTDRGKKGSKHHVLTDRRGIPLTQTLTAANVNETTTLPAMLDRVPRLPTRGGRPRRRPKKLHVDKGYASAKNRQACRSRGIVPRIPRKGVERSDRLGRYRWVVERTFGWLHRMRRLLVRYERRADIHEAFLTLGCALIALRALTTWFC
jgi:transposase